MVSQLNVECKINALACALLPFSVRIILPSERNKTNPSLCMALSSSSYIFLSMSLMGSLKDKNVSEACNA